MRNLKKMFVSLAVMIGMMFGLCAATLPAQAAPYGPGPKCTLKIVAPAGHHKYYRAITRCVYMGKRYRSVIVLHSQPVVLGTMESNAAGVATGEFNIPAGFSGHHTLEVQRLSSATAKPVVSEAVKATTTNVLMPFTIGKTTFAQGTSLLPSTSSDDGYSGLVVVGIGALGVVMLTGGGLLMFANRRRKVLA